MNKKGLRVPDYIGHMLDAVHQVNWGQIPIARRDV